MKKILSIWMLVVASFAAHAQFYNPVSWEFSQKIFLKMRLNYRLKQLLKAIGTCILNILLMMVLCPTFTFFNPEGVELLTDVLEPEPIEEFDPNFDMVLKYFKKGNLSSTTKIF